MVERCAAKKLQIAFYKKKTTYSNYDELFMSRYGAIFAQIAQAFS